MKKIIILFILILYSSNAHSNNIVYLDVQFIIDNSDFGIFYKNKIKKIQENNKQILKPSEEQIKKKELEINNQKNIISKDEIENKIRDLNILLKNFQVKRKELNNVVIDSKKKYTSEILKLLNPLITNYVEKNKILLVIEKKNILVGIKSLDITPNILKIINEETKKQNLINEN